MEKEELWGGTEEEHNRGILEREKFNVSQIKLTHYYNIFDNIEAKEPISVSIELTNIDNFWKKKIKYTYCGITNPSIDEYKVEESNLENSDKIIARINEFDLRELMNNYCVESMEHSPYWEIEYNNNFKIKGNYTVYVEAFEEISKILNFRQIIKLNLENDD